MSEHERPGVGHPVRSVATGRLGVVREVHPEGYVVKFGGRGTVFLRLDAVTADAPRRCARR